MATVLSTAAVTAQCEGALLPSEPDTQVESNVNDDEEEVVVVDPYDNLPEEDEPTHCSICLTYRQGPCRPYWRKVERCTKDNELKKDDGAEDSNNKEQSGSNEEEEADPPCLKYMLPWIDCASGFRNLYNLIELDTNYTAGIADLENEASKNLCWAKSKTPSVDWSAWAAYLQDNPDWKLPVAEKSLEHASLWKTLDQSKDPVLIEVTTTVETVEGEGMLECAYAQDQDGNVIGFQYGTKPSEAFDTEKTEDNEETEAKKEPTVTLKIRILPERTRTITIGAAYTQPPSETEKESKDLKKDSSFHSFIFKSRPIVLDQVELPKTEQEEES